MKKHHICYTPLSVFFHCRYLARIRLALFCTSVEAVRPNLALVPPYAGVLRNPLCLLFGHDEGGITTVHTTGKLAICRIPTRKYNLETMSSSCASVHQSRAQNYEHQNYRH